MIFADSTSNRLLCSVDPDVALMRIDVKGCDVMVKLKEVRV